ncbi:hypothetical protein JCM17823_19850 [Halorubrum gandharaense]
MVCPHCEAPVVAFVVPEELLAYAPARESAVCTRCLRTFRAAEAGVSPAGESAADTDFAAVDRAFPSGEAGVALALAVGKLESLALNRAAVEALVEHARNAGVDPWLFFERLSAPDAAFDVERRREQVLELVG